MGAKEIEAALAKVKGLPAPVKAWKVEKGRDATGEDAVWVWVTLTNKWADRSARSRLREIVRDTVGKSEGRDLDWVYVRFREESELEPG